jgi:hypothetical protein
MEAEERWGAGETEKGGQGGRRGRILHATTDQRRKTPSATAKADHDRMNAGDCRDHQDKMDSKREAPIDGSTRAESTERTARTWRTAGVRDVGATIQSANPKTKRPIEAVHMPALDRQRNTRAAIPVGEARPKTPMPAAKIEIPATITTSTAPAPVHFSTRRIDGSPLRRLDGI